MKAALDEQWARWPEGTTFPRTQDLGHDIPPGDVAAAAWFLERVHHRFPRGTVHLAVVDPGVGSARAPLAVAARGQFFVGPGNGLFAFLAAEVTEVVVLDNPLYHSAHGVSTTFHGRDIFAPVAAQLACGVPLDQVGNPCETALLGRLDSPQNTGQAFTIRWIDRFGNAITDLPRLGATGQQLDQGLPVEVGGYRVPGPLISYSEGSPGEPFWYWGSAGTLEIACRGESAARRLGLRPGLALKAVIP
jgi:S-adenosylmethionine hydrolase